MILRIKLCDLEMAKLTTVSFMHKLQDLNSSVKAQTSFTMAKLNDQIRSNEMKLNNQLIE